MQGVWMALRSAVATKESRARLERTCISQMPTQIRACLLVGLLSGLEGNGEITGDDQDVLRWAFSAFVSQDADALVEHDSKFDDTGADVNAADGVGLGMLADAGLALPALTGRAPTDALEGRPRSRDDLGGGAVVAWDGGAAPVVLPVQKYLKSDVIRVVGWLVSQPAYATLPLLAPEMARCAPLVLWAAESNTYLEQLATEVVLPALKSSVATRPDLFQHVALRLVSLYEHMSRTNVIERKLRTLTCGALPVLGHTAKQWQSNPAATMRVLAFMFKMTRDAETVEALTDRSVEEQLKNVMQALAAIPRLDPQLTVVDIIYSMLGKPDPVESTRLYTKELVKQKLNTLRRRAIFSTWHPAPSNRRFHSFAASKKAAASGRFKRLPPPLRDEEILEKLDSMAHLVEKEREVVMAAVNAAEPRVALVKLIATQETFEASDDVPDEFEQAELRRLQGMYEETIEAELVAINFKDEVLGVMVEQSPSRRTKTFAYALELPCQTLMRAGLSDQIIKQMSLCVTEIEAYYLDEIRQIHEQAEHAGVDAVLVNVLHSNRRMRMAALDALKRIAQQLVPSFKEPTVVLPDIEHTRTLRVAGADGLKDADWLGKSDPYVVVFWNGKKAGQTEVCKKTLSPRWIGKAGEFTLVSEKGPIFAGSLLLFVYDHDLVEPDFLGQAEVRFGQDGDPGGEEGEIESQTLALLTRSKEPAKGTMTVALSNPSSSKKRKELLKPNFHNPVEYAEARMAIPDVKATTTQGVAGDYSAVVQLVGVLCRLHCITTQPQQEAALNLLVEIHEASVGRFGFAKSRAVNLIGGLAVALHCYMMTVSQAWKLRAFEAFWRPHWPTWVQGAVDRYAMRELLYSSIEYLVVWEPARDEHHKDELDVNRKVELKEREVVVAEAALKEAQLRARGGWDPSATEKAEAAHQLLLGTQAALEWERSEAVQEKRNREAVFAWALEEQSSSFLEAMTGSQRESDYEDVAGAILIFLARDEEGRARLTKDADIPLLLRMLRLGLEPRTQLWALNGIPVLLDDPAQQAAFLEFKGVPTVMPYIDFANEPKISMYVTQILWQCADVMDDDAFAALVFPLCASAEARTVIGESQLTHSHRLRPFVRIVKVDPACGAGGAMHHNAVVSEWALLNINDLLIHHKDDPQPVALDHPPAFMTDHYPGLYPKLVTVAETAPTQHASLALSTLAFLVHETKEVDKYSDLCWYVGYTQQRPFRALRPILDSTIMELIIRQPWEPSQVFGKPDTRRSLHGGASAVLRYACRSPEHATRYGGRERGGMDTIGWGAQHGEDSVIQWAGTLSCFRPTLNFCVVNAALSLAAVFGLMPAIEAVPRQAEKNMVAVLLGYFCLETLFVTAFVVWATRDVGYKQATHVGREAGGGTSVSRWCKKYCGDGDEEDLKKYEEQGKKKGKQKSSAEKYAAPAEEESPLKVVDKKAAPLQIADAKSTGPSKHMGALRLLNAQQKVEQKRMLLAAAKEKLAAAEEKRRLAAEKKQKQGCCGRMAAYLETIFLVVDCAQLLGVLFLYHPVWTGREDGYDLRVAKRIREVGAGARTFYGVPISFVAEAAHAVPLLHGGALFMLLWAGCIVAVVVFLIATECFSVTIRVSAASAWHRCLDCGCVRRRRHRKHGAPLDRWSANGDAHVFATAEVIADLARQHVAAAGEQPGCRAKLQAKWHACVDAFVSLRDRMVLWILCPLYFPLVSALVSAIPCAYPQAYGEPPDSPAEQEAVRAAAAMGEDWLSLTPETATGGECWGATHRYMLGGSVAALAIFLPASVLMTPLVSARLARGRLPGHFHSMYLAARNLVRFVLAALLALAFAAAPPTGGGPAANPWALPAEAAAFQAEAEVAAEALEDTWGVLLDLALVAVGLLLGAAAIWLQYGLCPAHPNSKKGDGSRRRTCHAVDPPGAGTAALPLRLHLATYACCVCGGCISLVYGLNKPTAGEAELAEAKPKLLLSFATVAVLTLLSPLWWAAVVAFWEWVLERCLSRRRDAKIGNLQPIGDEVPP
jgi:hypothetical protein